MWSYCGCKFMVDYQPRYLPRLKTDLHIHIIDTVSRSTLTQTFVNPHKDKPVDEIEYVFPLYAGVSVVGFTCTVANRTINGVVQEREKAMSEYLAAKVKGKTAGLIQQSPHASDIFTASIGNVPAGETVMVKITYLGELKHDAEINGVRLTIPTHIAPRYGRFAISEAMGHMAKEEEGLSITLDAEMPLGASISTIQSPSHPISVKIGTLSIDKESKPSLNRASAALSIPLMGSLEKDCIFEVMATDLGESSAYMETHTSIPNQHALMATLVPKFSLPSEKPEIVFICDRSGSMEGKIENLIAALTVFLRSLPIGVKFNICSFGSSFDFLWPRSKTYDQQSLKEAAGYVETFSADYGGTEMYRPMEDTFKRRYRGMNLGVFLLTDGQIWDQQSLIDLINREVAKPEANVRVFTLGVGSGVSTSLIEGVAQAGKGFAQTVLDSEKMEKKVIRMLKGALLPQIHDYNLQMTYQDSNSPETDDFVVVEKARDSPDISSTQGENIDDKPVISLYNKSLDDESLIGDDDTKSSGVDDKYDHLPPVDAPRRLQTPTEIPPLYLFHRTTIYILLSPSAPEKRPKSVLLKATSSHGPLEVEIPIVHLPEPSTTIHQLAARREMKELEEGRGWLAKAKTGEGELLKTKYKGRFPDMVEREAVRIGLQFQVAGKWTSFVAVDQSSEAVINVTEKPVDGLTSRPGGVPAIGRQSIMKSMSLRLSALPRSTSSKKSIHAKYNIDDEDDDIDYDIDDGLMDLQNQVRMMSMVGRTIGREVDSQNASLHRIMQKSDAVDDAVRMNRQRLARLDGSPPAPKRSTAQTASFSAQESHASKTSQATVNLTTKVGHPNTIQELVSLQQFAGNWELSQELKTIIGFDPKGTVEANLPLRVKGHPNVEEIIATACALMFLKKNFAADKEVWDMLVDKAEAWLGTKVGEDVEDLFKIVDRFL